MSSSASKAVRSAPRKRRFSAKCRENLSNRPIDVAAGRPIHALMRGTCCPGLAAFVLTGCSVLDFDIGQNIPEQMVQGSQIPGPLAALFPIPISLDLESAIKAQNTGPIDSVTLSSLELTITMTDEPSGDTDDWSFVTSVDVFVESTK